MWGQFTEISETGWERLLTIIKTLDQARQGELSLLPNSGRSPSRLSMTPVLVPLRPPNKILPADSIYYLFT